jgi:hypothetical protein
MEELTINNHLLKHDLFELFKTQLKKDFESSGLGGDFVDHLSSEFRELVRQIVTELNPVINSGSSLLSSLLYRIDISELQLKKYQLNNNKLAFDEVLAELIIKRVLQKIILRIRFSNL